MNPIKDIILGLAQPVTDLIDSLHTSEEEKLNLKSKMFALQVALYEKVLEYEGKVVEAQSKIIEAEAKGESWLQRNWRPLMMLTFTGLILNSWLGITAILGIPTVYVPLEIQENLWAVVQIGIGGYVGGRTLEKIAPSVAEAIGHMKK